MDGGSIIGQENPQTRSRYGIYFKLDKLDSDTLRYDVIYKNLLRDFRRFYFYDFNSSTDYFRMKRRQIKNVLKLCVTNYIEMKGLDLFAENKGISKDTLVFALGALVYPKHMLKACDPNFSEKNALVLRKEIKNFWTPEARKIIKVYHYMYRFSVDLLYRFKKDEALMCLFEHYVLHHMKARMQGNKPMMKHVEAYNEAVWRMLENIEISKLQTILGT